MNAAGRGLGVQDHLHTQSGIYGLTGPIVHGKACFICTLLLQTMDSLYLEGGGLICSATFETYQASLLFS